MVRKSISRDFVTFVDTVSEKTQKRKFMQTNLITFYATLYTLLPNGQTVSCPTLRNLRLSLL